MKLPKAKRLDSGRWYIQVYTNGKRYSQAFDTEDEALYWAAGLKTKALEESIPKRDVTVSRAIEDYIAGRSNILSPSTLRGYRGIQKNYFQSLMGRKASTVKRADVQKEINDMTAEELSVKTIKNAVALLLSALQDYTDIDAKKLAYPPRVKREHAYLEAPDIARLLDVCRGTNIEIPVLLALWLGLRRSEICALDWEDFDFEKKKVNIHKALVQNEKEEYVLKQTTKTETSRRTLDLPEYLIARMEAHQPDETKRTGRITSMSPAAVYQRLKKVCKAQGIPFVGIHGLRHTNASVMLSIGITAKMAMARGGWSSKETMQNIYQHLFSDDRTEADRKINEYFDALTPKTPGEV